MNIAEQLMAVRGLQEGLAEVERKLKAQLIETSRETSATNFRTPMGPATVAGRKPAVELDAQRFLEFCKANHPDEVQTWQQVRDSFVAATLARLRIEGDDVVDEDGVVVDYARVRPAGEPYVTAKLADEVKAAAREQVAAGLTQLFGVLGVGSATKKLSDGGPVQPTRPPVRPAGGYWSGI